MDIVGPLPTTENGHSYKLIIQDLLTKYSVVIPLKQAKSSEIAKALEKKVYQPVYLAPNGWMTDQCPNFINSMMRHVIHKYKISIYKTWHRSILVEAIERSHHVLMDYLKQWSQNMTGINM